MPRQADWTVSATHLRTLHRAAENLKTALDKDGEPDKIEAHIKSVLMAADRMAQGTTFVEKTRGERHVVLHPEKELFPLPGLIRAELSKFAKRPRKKTQETIALLHHMTRQAGNNVYGYVRSALNSLRIKEYRLR